MKDFSVYGLLHLSERLMGQYKFKECRIKNGANAGLNFLLRRKTGYYIVYGNRDPLEDQGKKDYKDHFHFLAVNVPKKLVVDNKNAGAHTRLCGDTFTHEKEGRMRTVNSILQLWKFDGNQWLADF